jgi:hypothetical protein
MIVFLSELADASTNTVCATEEDETCTTWASRSYSRLVVTHLEAIVESAGRSLTVRAMVRAASTSQDVTSSG